MRVVKLSRIFHTSIPDRLIALNMVRHSRICDVPVDVLDMPKITSASRRVRFTSGWIEKFQQFVRISYPASLNLM